MRNLPLNSDSETSIVDPPIQWEDANCPLCGKYDPMILMESKDHSPSTGQGLIFAVCQCKNCDLIYTNPRPDQESIVGFYPYDYQPHRRSRKMKHAARNGSLISWLTGRNAPERTGDLPKHGRGRLLDFGCGGGSYLERMADRGWEVTGIDTAASVAEKLQSDQQLHVITGTLPHPELKPCSFDVITMWHSLEHVHEPLDTLRDAFDLLIPGGKLIVACPNWDSWPAKWFGADWFGLDLPRHLTHLTPKSLKLMLSTAGYIVESQRLIRHSDWLRSSAKFASRNADSPFWVQCLTWKPVAKLTAWLTYLCGKSDCQMAVAVKPVIQG